MQSGALWWSREDEQLDLHASNVYTSVPYAVWTGPRAARAVTPSSRGGLCGQQTEQDVTRSVPGETEGSRHADAASPA